MISTGIKGLDKVITGLRAGDNVVWQIDDIKDYIGIVKPFVEEALSQKKNVIYIRFASHQEVLTPSKKIKRYELNADEGFEFFATKVQQKLMEYCIKFRPIRPGSPHLNGKVERSQKTDLEEFYETVDIHSPDIEDLLQEWQHYYNWDRPHGSLGGKTPMDRYFEVSQKTPFWDEVETMYEPSKERVQEQKYWDYLRVKKLKLSM